jgi:hypothetical protein
VIRLGPTVPALPVVVIGPSVEFYRDRLGFAEVFTGDGYGIVRRDGAEIHLWEASDTRWQHEPTRLEPVRSGAETFLAGTASCRVGVQGIDELYDEFSDAGVVYPKSVVERTPWRTREFSALDLHRNLLTFFEGADA